MKAGRQGGQWDEWTKSLHPCFHLSLVVVSNMDAKSWKLHVDGQHEFSLGLCLPRQVVYHSCLLSQDLPLLSLANESYLLFVVLLKVLMIEACTETE